MAMCRGVLLQDQKRYKESIESYQAAIQCRSRMTSTLFIVRLICVLKYSRMHMFH